MLPTVPLPGAFESSKVLLDDADEESFGSSQVIAKIAININRILFNNFTKSYKVLELVYLVTTLLQDITQS